MSAGELQETNTHPKKEPSGSSGHRPMARTSGSLLGRLRPRPSFSAISADSANRSCSRFLFSRRGDSPGFLSAGRASIRRNENLTWRHQGTHLTCSDQSVSLASCRVTASRKGEIELPEKSGGLRWCCTDQLRPPSFTVSCRWGQVAGLNSSKPRYSSTTDPEVEITAVGNVRMGAHPEKNSKLSRAAYTWRFEE